MTGRWCSSEKEVLVAVYEERPGRSRLLPEGQGRRHRHHHHHHHHHFHVNVGKNDGRIRGHNYNRRAELLEYARHLRASSAQSPPRHIKQPSTLEISKSGDKKRKLQGSPPTCFDKWECIIPGFVRSITAFNTIKEKGKKNHKKKTVSTTTKMDALVKSLQVSLNYILR
ncbi:hypothetical protein ACS0TY_011386 [Phlomoides rotata]